MRRYLRLAVFVATLAMTLTTGTAALASAVHAPAATAVSVPATAATAAHSVRDQVAAAQLATTRVGPAAGAAGRHARHDAEALPPRSGSGKRVVFAMSAQRVWLVRQGDDVARTYEVSASRSDNLDPGSYEVYSRSRHATAYDLKSTMDYFVRFAHGKNAAIGFHDIPVDQAGKPLQTRSQLGTPLSSGCIRQARSDAVALWKFAPVGTKVVVVR